MRTELHLGDCLDVLRRMPDASLTACVCDPPYALEFMGEGWDSVLPPADTWREVRRVLKPGGMLLAFGGTRTYHRLACSIEDAGFKLHNCLMWVYGSGFPKSLAIDKAIDRARDEDREPVRVVCRYLRAAMELRKVKSGDLVVHFRNCNPRLIDHWAARDTDSQPSLPTWEQWETLREILELGTEMDAEVWRLNKRKGTPGADWRERKVVGIQEMTDTSKVHPVTTAAQGFDGDLPTRMVDLTTAATDRSRPWQGYGTALKPAWEPILLAMKPTDGTFANNALTHGVAGINVDGCRVDPKGRWPANLVHDGSKEVLDCLPGDVSRFYYCAKSSRRDRDFGLGADVPLRTRAEMTGRKEGSAGSQNPRAGSRRGRNIHPTVKPVELMRWLVRMVKMPGETTVLDPFMGSGSTGIACVLEDVGFVGIEREPDYLVIAEKRIIGTIAEV